ncbi:MAG: hypothetical protein WA089_03395 [Anaerolineae bacterium]
MSIRAIRGRNAVQSKETTPTPLMSRFANWVRFWYNFPTSSRPPNFLAMIPGYTFFFDSAAAFYACLLRFNAS